jgi:hypothetical protein
MALKMQDMTAFLYAAAGSDNPMDLFEVAKKLQSFGGTELTATLARIESEVRGLTSSECGKVLGTTGVNRDILTAAAALKRLAGQVNVSIHAAGILLCLPYILSPGEVIEHVSLGAGNTGREFDLETNYRVAEFKFIHWRGGPESIRQNQLFKDFYLLAENPSPKRKYLYVLGTEFPLKFLNGKRALASSVLSRNDKLLKQFQSKYGDRFPTVRDYFLPNSDRVVIEDISGWVPELISEVPDSE